MTTKTATTGTIEVIRHGQGYTLNVWARNDLGGVRFLCPRTLLESEGRIDLRDEISELARREFGAGVLRNRPRGEFGFATSVVAIFDVEVTR